MWRNLIRTGVVAALCLTVPTAAHAGVRAGCGGTGAVTTRTGVLLDGSAYLIQCPAHAWNGTLWLYSHGLVTPGQPNPAADAGDPVTASWLLGHGYAQAGSSYAFTGWAVQPALKDQIATLDVFGSAYGTPARTIAWGHSLGGMITAGLVQDNPGRFAAALPMCGVLSGGVATWNVALDAEFAFQQLIDPHVQVVHITSLLANLSRVDAAANRAQSTAQGRARLALAAALGDIPGWFTPLSPAPVSYAGQETAQYQWAVTSVDFAFAFGLRAQIEALAGGNPSWNTGVNYTAQLARSADAAEVRALYRAAGLSLGADLRKLSQAPRIGADQAAVRYVAANVTFTGRIDVPVLTLQTTGDGIVVPENEQAYRQAVSQAGDARLLRQLYVQRAGHCTFTPAETITAVQALLGRLSTGAWHIPAPIHLNEATASLGSRYNVYLGGAAAVPTSPAFAGYAPGTFPRPYALAR